MVAVGTIAVVAGWLGVKAMRFFSTAGLVVSVDRKCAFESVSVDGQHVRLEGANWVHLYPGTNTIEAKMPGGTSQVTSFEMPKREQYGVISCNPLGIDMSD